MEATWYTIIYLISNYCNINLILRRITIYSELLRLPFMTLLNYGIMLL